MGFTGCSIEIILMSVVNPKQTHYVLFKMPFIDICRSISMMTLQESLIFHKETSEPGILCLH